MQGLDTIRDGDRVPVGFLSLNWDWLIYLAAILFGLSLGAFLALV
jgi:hypothetical protein